MVEWLDVEWERRGERTQVTNRKSYIGFWFVQTLMTLTELERSERILLKAQLSAYVSPTYLLDFFIISVRPY